MVAALGRRLLGLGGQRRCVPDSVGQGQKVVRAGLLGRCGHGQPQDFPAAGNGEGVCVLFAEIVTVGLGVRGERTQDRGGVCVHVGQSCHR